MAFEARAAYPADGEGPLQVGDKQLTPWQVARLALEEMFSCVSGA